MPGSSDSKSDIGWIVPVCRPPKELGMKLVWGNRQSSTGGSGWERDHPAVALRSPIHGVG
eukprot:3435301-Prorocentrum_lima.AAC.1